MLNTYEEIISAHLSIIFSRGDLVTSVVVIESSRRELVIDLATRHGYIPAFSSTAGGYFQFCGIKSILPC